MSGKLSLLVLAAATIGLAPAAFSQTATLSVAVNSEATLTITNGTTNLTSATTFGDFSGATNFNYKVRTKQNGGSGNITVQVSSDFGAGGPSAAAGNLTYGCTTASSATPCTGSVIAKTTGATNVATFANNAHSSKSGDAGSVNWTLANDPAYQTGSYSATVTFIISAT